jgi:amidase
MKPTIGLVSGSGIIPISHNFDSAGPMTKVTYDLAILLDAIAEKKPGMDPDESYTRFLTGSWEGLSIGALGPETWTLPESWMKPVKEAKAEAGFMEEMNAYLADLEGAEVKNVEELIQFNKDHADVELPPGNIQIAVLTQAMT